MRKRVIGRICGLILAFALLAGGLTVAPRLISVTRLTRIPNESPDTPNCMVYGTLYTSAGETDLSAACLRNGGHLLEVFCMDDQQVFLSCEMDGDWVIASVDLQTSVFKTHCRLPGAKGQYRLSNGSPYGEKSGYYWNGEIVLNDFNTILTYDIAANTSRTVAYAEYGFPAAALSGEAIDPETIRFSIENTQMLCSLAEMASESPGIAQLYSLGQRNAWNGASPLRSFFSSDSICAADGRVYAIGEFFPHPGRAYAVILEYDAGNGAWRYVTSLPAGDQVHSHCYLVNEIAL